MKPRKNFTVHANPDRYCELWILGDERENPELDEAYAAAVNDALKASRKPLRYVATSGDLGMDVRFYTDALEYARAVKYVMAEHKSGHVDQYLHGDCRP
jgi:hypothetical protein